MLKSIKFCPKCQSETVRYASGRCKQCVDKVNTAWREANRDRAKEMAVAYRLNNPEKARAATAAWRNNNPEKMQAIRAAWTAANPERHRETNAIWSASNPEKVKALSAAWHASHREESRISVQNRRARIRKNGGRLSKNLASKLFKLQKGKCACCGLPLGENYHLDHIMPTALGGSNTDDNIQLLRQHCNHQKNAKHPVTFMQERGFLL